MSVCVYECVSVCGYMSLSVRAPTWRKQEALPRKPRKQKGSKGQRLETGPHQGVGRCRETGWGRQDSRQTCRAGRRGCWGSQHLRSGPLP